MVFAYKSLADGQLPAAKATLYTCPAGVTAEIHSIKYVNVSGAGRTVNLYFKRSGSSSRRIAPMNLALAVGSMMQEDEGFEMSPGDEIEGDADAATSVDYSVTGAER